MIEMHCLATGQNVRHPRGTSYNAFTVDMPRYNFCSCHWACAPPLPPKNCEPEESYNTKLHSEDGFVAHQCNDLSQNTN